MKRTKKLLWALALLFTAGASHAATTQGVDIKVSISATKSVLIVGATTYDFGALAVNTASNSATAIVVRNDSGSLQETYTMLGQNAASLGAGTTWDISSSTGALDDYILAAKFGTSRPDNLDENWTDDKLDLDANVCSADIHGNGTEAQSGYNVSPSAGSRDRNLWFRIVTPAMVSDTTARQATVTIGVN